FMQLGILLDVRHRADARSRRALAAHRFPPEGQPAQALERRGVEVGPAHALGRVDVVRSHEGAAETGLVLLAPNPQPAHNALAVYPGHDSWASAPSAARLQIDRSRRVA